MYERWHEVTNVRARQDEVAHEARWAAVQREAQLSRERPEQPKDERRARPQLGWAIRLAQVASAWLF